MTGHTTMGRFRIEIAEQGQALRDLIDACETDPDPLQDTATLIRRMPEHARLYFTGMGSSLFAAYAACCQLWDGGARPQWCEAGELLHYQHQAIRSGDVVVMISQSGETVEIRKLIDLFGEDVNVVGITNDPTSTLAQRAMIVLEMHAGNEQMSTSKTYTNTLLLLRGLVRLLTGTRCDPWDQAAMSMPDMVDALIVRWDERAEEMAVFFRTVGILDFIGRGPAYATALQSSVVLKEGAHVVCEALTGATFRHGPIEAAGPGHGAVVFAPQGRGFGPSVKLAEDLCNLGSQTAIVTNNPTMRIPGNALAETIGPVDEIVFTLLSAIPFELLIVSIARAKGLEPGALTVGNKITSTE